ncbi:MAG: histidine phosphotransferase, partial [Methylobacteriaceae bacterium]|nr:histidine phosphotransferase [Methylobacteriaceae bacterium]
ARIAFGAAGSRGAEIDLGDAEQVARSMFSDEKLTLEWDAPRIMLPKNKVKLLLNLLIIAQNAIPRGGILTVTLTNDDNRCSMTVRCAGTNARIPAKVEELIAGEPESGAVDAHAIQPYFTGLVARASLMSVHFAMDDADMVITATQDEAVSNPSETGEPETPETPAGIGDAATTR